MKQSHHIGTILLFLLLLLFSCSTIRQIRPLDKGQSSATLSVGGPITKIGDIYIPLPLLSVGYNRGLIDKKLDFEGGLYITQLLYGILDLEAGVNYRPFISNRWRPGLIVSPKIFLLTNFQPGGFRIYPDLCLTGFWEVRENWFEFSQEREDGNKQENHWLITPYIGINLGNEKWQFQFETRVYTPNLKNTGRPTENIGLGDYGVLGFFLGLNYTFGKEKK